MPATVEQAFNLLAEAADVRYPHPDRQNKGFCPGHDDHNNPGLAFTISDTTGNLLVHCFARECDPADVATAIGLPLSAFFRDSKGIGERIETGITWTYPNVLELMKMLPLNYSWEEQQEAVFRVLAACQEMGGDVWECEKPYHEVPYHIMRDVLIYNYCEQDWLTTKGEDWMNGEGTGYADKRIRLVRTLSQEARKATR